MAHISRFAGAIGATLEHRTPSHWLALGDVLDLLPDGGIDTGGIDAAPSPGESAVSTRPREAA